MKVVRKSPIAISVLTLACAVWAVPASGQSAGCSAPDLEPVADGWLPISIGLDLAERRCQARDFIKRVFSSEDDPDKITPVHVLEASRPKLNPDQQRARDEFLAKEKIKLREQREYSEHMHANMATEAVTAANAREVELRNSGVVITKPFQSYPDGSTYYIVPGANPNDPPKIVWAGVPPKEAKTEFTGDGVILSEDGITSGTFKDGQLEGTGEEIEENGTWRAGQFDNGQLDGVGVEVDRGADGRTYMVTGKFEDDYPDGQVTVTYADGSQRRQLWDDRQLRSQGAFAAPGKPLVDAPAYRPSPAVAAYESALTWEMIAQKPGGTLDGTFESNGQPTGEMIRRYPDGTSQRELWEGGKVVGRGAVSGKGLVPPPIGRLYKPALPPRSTWKPAMSIRPRPAPVASGDSGYSSLCKRDYLKVQDVVMRMGGVDYREGMRAYSAYMQLWGRCRGSDPEADQYYADMVNFLREAQSRGDRDTTVPANAPFFDAVSRALSDPNYSADLGPVRGQASVPKGSAAGSGGAAGSGPDEARGSEEGPAPGTSVGSFEIINPVLPAWQSKYAGKGLSPDTIAEQESSDPELQRIQAQLNATRDVIIRLRLLIAQLEGMIVIHRQSQDVPGERQRIRGMVESRNAAIANCQNVSSNPGLCTTPFR